MVGTSRGSSGRGARLYGPVQRVQRRPLRSAVGARREAGPRAEGGASHCERGADAGERGAAAGGGDTGGVGAVVAGGGGLGRAAAGGSAGAGGVGGDERAGAARDVASVGGWWGAIAGAMGMERGMHAAPPVDLGWAHPPTLGCIFWIVGAHPPHPLPEGGLPSGLPLHEGYAGRRWAAAAVGGGRRRGSPACAGTTTLRQAQGERNQNGGCALSRRHRDALTPTLSQRARGRQHGRGGGVR